MLHKIKTKYQQHKLRRAQKKEMRSKELNAIRNMASAYDDAVISWIAPETISHQRGPVWKVMISLAILAAIIWGLFNNAWTFSLAIAAFAFAYYIIHLEHPKAIEVKISNIGIKIGYRKYTYSQIRAFWVIYDPPYVQTLNIRIIGEFINDITIQMPISSPSEVREFLLTKIPELEGQHEKFSDVLLRLFKI